MHDVDLDCKRALPNGIKHFLLVEGHGHTFVKPKATDSSAGKYKTVVV